MSEDLQPRISRRKWSVNSSETSRDDTTGGDREPNEEEFWELIEKDRNTINEVISQICLRRLSYYQWWLMNNSGVYLEGFAKLFFILYRLLTYSRRK